MRHANRATAHLYIENPLKKTKEVTGVFDTHPPVGQRIAVLLAMAHVGPEALAERPVTAAADAPEPGAVRPGAGAREVPPPSPPLH